MIAFHLNLNNNYAFVTKLKHLLSNKYKFDVFFLLNFYLCQGLSLHNDSNPRETNGYVCPKGKNYPIIFLPTNELDHGIFSKCETVELISPLTLYDLKNCTYYSNTIEKKKKPYKE